MVFQKGHKFTPKKKVEEEVKLEEVKVEETKIEEVKEEVVVEKVEEVTTTANTNKRRKICVITREEKKLVSIYEDEYSPELHICI